MGDPNVIAKALIHILVSADLVVAEDAISASPRPAVRHLSTALESYYAVMRQLAEKVSKRVQCRECGGTGKSEAGCSHEVRACYRVLRWLKLYGETELHRSRLLRVIQEDATITRCQATILADYLLQALKEPR